MSETVKVRKVHLDYAGADGLPKPMEWVFAADGSRDDDYATRAREVFRRNLPEWQLRGCVVAAEDIEVPERRLRPVFDESRVWRLA